MMNHVYIHIFRNMTSECKRQMKLWPLLTPRLSIIAALQKNISEPKIVNWSATVTGLLSATCSTASLGSAISVVGLPVLIALGGVGGTFALASSGLIFTSKKLDSKIKKHQEIMTLAISKGDTVYRLNSKALADNQISDREFQLIMDEYSQYNVLKAAIRSKLTKNLSQFKSVFLYNYYFFLLFSVGV